MTPSVSCSDASAATPEEQGSPEAQQAGLHPGLHQTPHTGRALRSSAAPDATVAALAALFHTLSAEQRAALAALLDTSGPNTSPS